MNPIDFVYMVFVAISLFFSFLFFMLYWGNRRLLWVMPRLKTFPAVSIIVPAYNEERSIAETLSALKQLDWPSDKLDIIVVDDGSTDRTAAIASSFSGIRIIKKPNGGKANALNVGIAAAKGEFVACVDADSRLAPDALRKAMPYFAEADVGAVTTSIYVREPQNLLQRLQRMEYIMIVWSRKLLEFMDSVYVTPGPLSIYRRDVLKEVGGFDETNITEDIEIAWRLMAAGYKIKMALGARCYTSAPKTFRQWWRQRLRWNIGGLQTTIKYGYTFLKNDFRSLGLFVLPFFSISYIVSVIGLSVFSYLILRRLVHFALYSTAASGLGANPLVLYEFVFAPDLFTIFGFLIFALSLIWIRISLSTVQQRLGGLRGALELLLYLSIYIMIFPINLLQATYRLLTRKKHQW